MDQIIVCVCAHTIGAHNADGCERCGCALHAAAVLEDLIGGVRENWLHHNGRLGPD